ncbi:hypothetical protein CYLTODRAFT_118577 [Cylindrobasidium torrendii FP15055 ss-10]|uniref:Uncharacterized protein n=1 Tax=Cylindrobasidium torrendii FP15055 ss-10 TaxID=1314674 RepID=A0A0D7BM70_9AGAR|nr:hypothetical protein CYLTODRAFT_118577 [Cylindrobasidium torrendii FP15055 ss-10]
MVTSRDRNCRSTRRVAHAWTKTLPTMAPAPMRTERAIPTKISNVSHSHVDCKLRLAGRAVAYAADNAHFILIDEQSNGLVVNAADCLSAWDRWPRTRGTVMVIGRLELVSDTPVSHIPLPYHINPLLVLHALHIGDIGGEIDLEEWNTGIDSLPPVEHELQ